MRIASCIEDGFSFISHSDSIEQELPLDVYMGPLVYVYDAMGTDVYTISQRFFFTNLAQYSSLISNSLSFLSSFRLIRPWREM